MIFVLTACGSNEESSGRSIFGNFKVETLDGNEVTDKIFEEAELTMVNIWGTFCGPCINEMPALGEISREYEGKGFQIVGLISDVTEAGDETALQIVEETQADYVHMVASEDHQKGILKYINTYPTTIFVDKDGNVVGEIQVGAQSKDQWETLIDEYLNGEQ